MKCKWAGYMHAKIINCTSFDHYRMHAAYSNRYFKRYIIYNCVILPYTGARNNQLHIPIVTTVSVVELLYLVLQQQIIISLFQKLQIQSFCTERTIFLLNDTVWVANVVRFNLLLPIHNHSISLLDLLSSLNHAVYLWIERVAWVTRTSPENKFSYTM